MSERKNIKGSSVFYIDTFIALITYEEDYIHMGLVSEDRFKRLKTIENIAELVENLSGLDQFSTNKILDMILEHKEVEIVLGKKYDNIIIFKGTVEDLFYNVIDGKGYNDVDISMLKLVTRKEILNSKLVLNKTHNMRILHEFSGCRLINEAVANAIEVDSSAIERFVNYMDDLDCSCKYKNGTLEKIDGHGISICLNDNPFNFILREALNECEIFDMTIDSDTVWETNSITNSKIDTLTLKECKIYNEGCIFYNCKIEKLIVKRKEVPSYLFSNCDINSIVLSDDVKVIGKSSLCECNIKFIETARVSEIEACAFKGCKIGMLVTSEWLSVLREESLYGTTVDSADIDFDNLLNIGNYAFSNSSINTHIVLEKKLNYVGHEAFVNSNITELINKTDFEVSLEGCMNLKKLDTYSKLTIDSLNIEEVILRYNEILHSTINNCNNLDTVIIECNSKLLIDMDFIINSSLNKLVINADEIIYSYDGCEISEDVFIDSIVNNVNNSELEIVVNGNTLEYVEDEL